MFLSLLSLGLEERAAGKEAVKGEDSTDKRALGMVSVPVTKNKVVCGMIIYLFRKI